MGADGVAIVRHRCEWATRKPRYGVNVNAIVYRSDESKVAARLINMSFDGCGLIAAYPFEAGERVRIAVHGQGYIEAEMRWSSDGCAGATFLCECHV